MDNIEFRAFLDLLMCSDPWPICGENGQGRGEDTIKNMANRIAVERGYENWVDAYHRHTA
ncbi:MAG: hypothetical protein U1E83_01135 [Methylotetracoccus sp.]